jgi:hypothetical protein
MFRAALALLTLTTAASAQLQWADPLQEFQRLPEDKFVQTRFAFRNSGSAPVTIKKISTSCGCTTAKLDKKTYAPGESGEIEAKFTFSGRTGPQRKIITVVSDDPAQAQTVLDLRVWVNRPLAIKPGLVFWRVGDAGEAKSVQLTAEGQKVGIKASAHRIRGSKLLSNGAAW